MTQEHLHSGSHPDADQLSAFAENALNQREREKTLRHLAECATCRSIVFLAQEPFEPMEPVPTGAPAAPFWRRWLAPLSLAGAALACGLLVTLWLHTRPAPTLASPSEIAKSTPQNDLPATDSNAIEPRRRAISPERRTSHAIFPAEPSATSSSPPASITNEAARPAPTGTPARTNSPPPAAPAAPGNRAPFGITANRYPAGAAAAPPSTAPANAASANGFLQNGESASAGSIATAQPPSAQSLTAPTAAPQAIGTGANKALPLNGRNLLTLAPAKLTPSASLVTGGPLTLSIEHDQLTVDGFSEVTGSVVDPTGAVIPGATVTWSQNGANVTGKTTTGTDGRFTLAALPAGSYTLEIASPGFRVLSQRLDLLSRDLATLHSTLELGATTETVMVTGATEVSTMNAAVTGTLKPAAPHPLPSGQPPVMTVQQGKSLLAVDAAGTLFYSRNGGKHWKTVKPHWPGKVAQLSLANGNAAGTAHPGFQLTTDQGVVWLSDNGLHWHPR